jgi:hypothetical protein
LILLLSVTILHGQSLIIPINDKYAKIHKDELKFIETVFVDYVAVKELRIKDLEKIGILERVINDKDKLINEKNADIEMLKQQIDDISPSWWNKFSYGFIAGLAAAISIIKILIK